MLSAVAALLVCMNPYLAEARQHYDALEFDAAARSFAVALEQPDLSLDERRAAYSQWAQALLALSRHDEAEQVFVRWLTSDPVAPTPRAAPKVVEAFLRARQRVWPKPSVKWARLDDAGPAVRVELFDPWALTARVRWLEANERSLVERPTPPLEAQVLTVQPSAGAQRLLFDALDGQGALLAHLEVSLRATAPVTEAASTRAAQPVRWAPVVVLAAGLVGAGVGAVFLGLGYRQAPSFTAASDINAWNTTVATQAGLGWALVATGVAAAGAGGVLFAF